MYVQVLGLSCFFDPENVCSYNDVNFDVHVIVVIIPAPSKVGQPLVSHFEGLLSS